MFSCLTMKRSGIVTSDEYRRKSAFCYNRWEKSSLLFLYLKIVFYTELMFKRILTFYDIYVGFVKVF